jgi:hypothetical protein
MGRWRDTIQENTHIYFIMPIVFFLGGVAMTIILLFFAFFLKLLFSTYFVLKSLSCLGIKAVLNACVCGYN